MHVLKTDRPFRCTYICIETFLDLILHKELYLAKYVCAYCMYCMHAHIHTHIIYRVIYHVYIYIYIYVHTYTYIRDMGM
jgi:hypothetical protein